MKLIAIKGEVSGTRMLNDMAECDKPPFSM